LAVVLCRGWASMGKKGGPLGIGLAGDLSWFFVLSISLFGRVLLPSSHDVVVGGGAATMDHGVWGRSLIADDARDRGFCGAAFGMASDPAGSAGRDPSDRPEKTMVALDRSRTDPAAATNETLGCRRSSGHRMAFVFSVHGGMDGQHVGRICGSETLAHAFSVASD